MTDLLTGLVECLQAAASAAIADQRPDLERDPNSLHGVPLDLTISTAVTLKHADIFTKRRRPVTALLDHQTVRAS